MSEPPPKPLRAEASSSAESLPELVGRLGEDLATLFDSQLGLFKLEVKDELRSYVRDGIYVAAGVLVAVVGVGLVSAAAALFIAMVLANAGDLTPPTAYALGFLTLGAVCIGGGLIASRRAASRLMETQVAPPRRSLQELEKEREWLTPGSS